MTCVVGLKLGANKGVIIGTDSMAVADDEVYVEHENNKIVEVRGMIMGFSGNSRAHNLVKHVLDHSKLNSTSQDAFSFLVKDFVPRLLTLCEEAKCLKFEDGEADWDCNILVGVKDRLFNIQGNLQVFEVKDYDATGSGAPYALGSMASTVDMGINPEGRVKLALQAAAKHCTSVCGPFHYANTRP